MRPKIREREYPGILSENKELPFNISELYRQLNHASNVSTDTSHPTYMKTQVVVIVKGLLESHGVSLPTNSDDLTAKLNEYLDTLVAEQFLAKYEGDRYSPNQNLINTLTY